MSKTQIKKQNKLTADDLKFSWEFDEITAPKGYTNINTWRELSDYLKKSGLPSITRDTGDHLAFNQQVQNLKNNLARIADIKELTERQNLQGTQYNELNTTLGDLKDTATTQLKELREDTDANIADLKILNELDFSGLGNIAGNVSDIAQLQRDVRSLEELLNPDTPVTTEIGDVTGLQDIIDNLQENYRNLEIPEAPDLTGLITQQELDTAIQNIDIPDAFDPTGLATKTQLEKAISDLGLNEFMKEKTFSQAMTDRLDALSSTLKGEFASSIPSLDTDAVRKAFEEGGSLSDLTQKFTGISSDLDWINNLKDLDFNKLDTDVSNLQEQFANLNIPDAPDLTGLVTEDELSKKLDNLPETDLTGINTRLDTQSTNLQLAENRFAKLLQDDTDTLRDLLEKSEKQLGKDLEEFASGATTARESLYEKLSGETATKVAGEALARQTGLDAEAEARRIGLSSAQEARNELAKQLESQGYNIDNLSTQLLGYGDDLVEYQKQFKDDLTDLRGIVGNQRELALGALEDKIGDARVKDLLTLKEGLEKNTLSEVQKMAGNLRQEYGDKVFDLTREFDKSTAASKLARQELGADIQDLFGRSIAQDTSVAGLTTNVGTLGQNLDALKSSFGDYKLNAATNLGNVQRALQGEIGNLSGSLTSGLANIKSDYVDRILGAETAGAKAREGLRSDLTGVIGTGLASEAAARQSGFQSAEKARERISQEASSGFQDVYKTREQALADLSGRFGESLRAQETSLSSRIQAQAKATEDRIGRLGSMMNYRMLGDSAGGVKMRRSKAYKSGAVNTGTGQLSRSMKLKTLNI